MLPYLKNMMEKENNRSAKIEIHELKPLVPLQKSHKLSSLRNKSTGGQAERKPADGLLTGQHNELLTYAQTLIDLKIKSIMDSYPSGRRMKLFTVRFGSMESIKMMTIACAFERLQIDTGKINLKPLANKNYYGNQVE